MWSFTSVVFLRSIFYPNQNIYIGFMLGLNALLFYRAQLCSKLDSLPCLWLPALPLPVPEGSIFLESPSIRHHQLREDTISRWSPSHTHFKVQMLSRRRWRVTFMLLLFFLRLQKRDNVQSRCFSGHDKCFKNPKQQRNMGFLLSRGLFKTCKVIRFFSDKSKEPPPPPANR